MKTSNYILFSFLIFLFGGISLLCFGSKYYKSFDDPTNFKIKEKKLSSFSVVVADSGANFNLRNAKENKIIQPYRKDSIANFPPFIVRNDTLFISSAKQIHGLPENYRVATEVYCINLKNIVVKGNSYISMNDFKVDTLMININKSKLDLRFDSISYISLQSKNSEIYLEGKQLEKLVVNLVKTKFNSPINNKIASLSGTLRNTSDCSFCFSNRIYLEVDKTSTYRFY